MISTRSSITVERRQAAQAGPDGDVRRGVKRLVPRQQRAAPGLEPRALRDHGKLRGGEFLAQRRHHRVVAGETADQQHPPQLALRLLQERHHLARHDVMQRAQNVLGRRFLPVELVRDVGFAVDRAAGGQRHHLPLERAPNRLLETQPHPANLLHEKLAAAGGALVVREDIGDPSRRQKIDQERLSAQRDHRVKAARQLAQGSLGGRHLGKVSLVPGDPKVFSAGKLGRPEQLLKDLDGAAQVGGDSGRPSLAPHRRHLHRQRAQIHADATDRNASLERPFAVQGNDLFDNSV